MLGDQLSFNLSSLDGADPAATINLMMEVADETIWVKHHKRKIAFILSAMPPCRGNALYWDSLARNRDRLSDNQRLVMPYRNWDRMDAARQKELRAQAAVHLQSLDALPDGY